MSGGAQTMEAAVIREHGQLAVEERPVPELRSSTDVLLDVEGCGICGTDLHILSDPPQQPATVGAILGHEFIGRVRAVGEDVADLEPGTRVAVAPNLSCGQCAWCRRGLRNHCAHWTTHGIYIDGGLARHVVVRASSCFPIDDRIPTPIATLVEPLSAVVGGVRLAQPLPGETVAVIGGGPVGLMFAALFKLAGATVVVIEPSEDRARLAVEMGADEVVHPDDEPVSHVQALSESLGADVVVDAVGSQLATALDLVRKAGRVVLFGMNERAHTDLAQIRITRDELQLFGAFVGQDVFPDAIRLIEQGRLRLEPLVTHRITLPELPGAVTELRDGRAVKVQVQLS